MSTTKSTDYDFLYKICLTGPSGAGKSSLLVRLCQEKFEDNKISTIGVDFFIYQVDVTIDSGQTFRVKLQLWDTAGQERFRSVVAQQFRGSEAAVLVFDLHDPSSFDTAMDGFLEEVQKYNVPRLIVVGNKCDLSRNVTITQLAAIKAKEPNMTYISTSAKTAENVQECFQGIAKDLVEAQVKGEIVPDHAKGTFNLQNASSAINEERTVQSRKCCGGSGS